MSPYYLMANSYAKKKIKDAKESGVFDGLSEEQSKAKRRDIYNESFSSVIKGLNDGVLDVVDIASSPLVSAVESVTDNPVLSSGAAVVEMFIPGGVLKKAAKAGANKITKSVLKKQRKNLRKHAIKKQNILTKGDRWSREPKSIQDQMALAEAKAGSVNAEKLNITLKDPKYIGMDKMRLTVQSKAERQTVIHYIRDPKTGKCMDFKFKKHSKD